MVFQKKQALLLLVSLLLQVLSSDAFVLRKGSAVSLVHSTALHMAAAKKKSKKKANTGGGGLKGFGGVATKTTKGVDLDRSKDARAFYDFLENGGAGANLDRCALGYFPLSGTDAKLRGIVALKPIKKGDVIIRIPYEVAVNLGPEGADPTGPATKFLKDYCQVLNDGGAKDAYYKMLPPFQGEDCLGSADFFSDDALEALQAPLVAEETRKRRERTLVRYQMNIANSDDFPKWIDGTTDVTAEHLKWAVWLITSRVLTVQGEEEEGKSYRLLIPFLDMCNHDRASPHILTGRAVPGGELKVVAGAAVKEGDQINICYGGGMAGNDRFIQDYGFLDSSENNKAYEMVSQQILGKRRILEGAGAGRTMAEIDRDNAMKQLRSTTIEEDEKLLEAETDPVLCAAYSYRLGVKRSLAKFIVMQ